MRNELPVGVIDAPNISPYIKNRLSEKQVLCENGAIVEVAMAHRTSTSRSEHSCSYLTQEQLARARRLTAVQKSKAQTLDISGEQVEELVADILGGVRVPGRSNRPIADIIVGGTGISVKSLAIKATASRPDWSDWLGKTVSIPMTRLRPAGELPKGKTLCNVSVGALGRRLVAGYNQLIETYGVERQAVLLRLRCEEEKLWRYYYWEQPVELLDAKEYRWANSKAPDPWARNVKALPKDAGKQQAADLTWASNGGVLYQRHQIPADADTWVICDAETLTREEATAAISAAIEQRLTR